MAVTTVTKDRRPSFAMRLTAVSGIFVLAAGLALWQAGLTWTGVALAVLGGSCALVGLIMEVRQSSTVIADRRSVFGFNAVLQAILAIALTIGVNAYSFFHYLRFDLTRDRHFTLPASIKSDMRQLQGETTIVLHQRHKTLGQLSDKPDAYDYAAERKVVEKVRDFIDQFRELGRQFNVVILDVEEEGYSEKLAALTAGAPELRQAIDSTGENSIFFYNQHQVQRLGFHDVFQLDKQSSQEAGSGKGNLVLLDQGVKPLASKILNIDEKKPKIALATVHEVLSLEGSDELGMAGVKKTLEQHGFNSKDIILKKWNEMTGPEPAVSTFDESKYERLEAEVSEVDADIHGLEAEIKELKALQSLWKTASLGDLTKKYADQLQGQSLTEDIRARQVALVDRNIALRDFLLGQQREDREALARQQTGLRVDSLEEQRRIADLRAKANRMLADCDLLIIPRMTLFNVARGEYIPNRVYKLDPAQLEAIKDFIKSGKPVLVLIGPSNEPANRMEPSEGPDQFEFLLRDLGIQPANQTVLFNVESKSFAERRGGLLVLGANVEVPPVEFNKSAPRGQTLLGRTSETETKKPNPIGESMELTARSLGKDQSLDLRLRAPRPIYYEGGKDAKPAFQPEFMSTANASWNEDQPFPTRERTPRYEPPKGHDPAAGTIDEKRRGPFPIGVAIETAVPKSWYPDAKANPAAVRVVAIGHGGIFIGPTLSPVREKLLLDTCNWLLGRDDLLTSASRQWKFPRLEMSAREQSIWEWGTRLGLPALAAYCGVVVLMVRRLR
jgi:hypothetical protein